MPEKNRPLSASSAPDTATCYERSKPETEAGQGRLDNNDATPTDRQDCMENAARNKQNPENQLNGEDVVDSSAKEKLGRK